MSKRKNGDDYKQSLEHIRELLPRIKILLASDLASLSATSIQLLHEQLARITAGAELITEIRKGDTSRATRDIVDELDRDGTFLWNLSFGIRDMEGYPHAARTYSSLRLAGFRLLQAGMESEPKEDSLVNLTQLACKVAVALIDANEYKIATRILSSAASYEEALRALPYSRDGDACANEKRALVRAQTSIGYYRARMTAAWREGNEGVAQFMLEKISGSDVELLSTLDVQDAEALVRDILEIGKALLQPKEAGSVPSSQTSNSDRVLDPRKAQTAVEYIQKAYSILEKIEDRSGGVIGSGSSMALKRIKKATLRTLARAYFYSHSLNPENLMRAETTLEELIREVGSHQGTAEVASNSSEADDKMRYMLLAVRRKRPAALPAIEAALKGVIEHAPCNETSIQSVLTELKQEAMNPHFATLSALLLEHVLESKRRDDVVISHVVLFVIFHFTRHTDAQGGFLHLAQNFDRIYNSGFAIDQTTSGACITLLWQAADRHYKQKKHSIAAMYYEIAAHKVFASLGPSTLAKCYRKAAVCLLNAKEFARAAQTVKKGDEKGAEAGTWYILFLVAVEQELEDEAARAAEKMVTAHDFDPRMLQLAMQMASERGQRSLLFAVLDLLLRAIRGNITANLKKVNLGIETLTLVRCLIRLAREELSSRPKEADALLDTIIRHLRTAKTLVEEAFTDKRENERAQDISWLWRTSHNLAVECCSSWGGSSRTTSELFQLTADFLEMYTKAVIVDAEPEAWYRLAFARFAAISGRVFAFRVGLKEGNSDEASARSLAADLPACRKRLRGIIMEGKITLVAEVDRITSIIRTIMVFEAEVYCMLAEWRLLADTIEDVTREDNKASEAFDAIADVLWSREDCPTDVLLLGIEALLHASVSFGNTNMAKFSRWIRIITTVLLARGTEIDRTKALGYLEQAVELMQGGAEDDRDSYPLDERHWILATTYNTGVDCFQASLLEEAKRWTEAALSTARAIPGNAASVERVSKTYQRILASSQEHE